MTENEKKEQEESTEKNEEKVDNGSIKKEGSENRDKAEEEKASKTSDENSDAADEDKLPLEVTEAKKDLEKEAGDTAEESKKEVEESATAEEKAETENVVDAEVETETDKLSEVEAETETEVKAETEKTIEDEVEVQAEAEKTTDDQSETEAEKLTEVEAKTTETIENAEEENTETEEVSETEAKTEAEIKIDNTPETAPEEVFDWDAFLEDEVEYSKTEIDKLEKLYADSFSDIAESSLTQAQVVAITDKDVVLNVGYKSDGLVPLSEFKYNPDIKIGDEVEVFIERKEDENGQILLSHKRAKSEKAWVDIVDAHEKDVIVKGYIKDRTKGGMVVDLLGMDAFLPGSQIDIKPIKDYDSYVGQSMELKVVKLNYEYRNIVVSHKAIIESDLEQQKTEILSKLEKGQVLEGVVKNLTSFGVFVDLGGVDGLIHITDVSWGRISHPEEVLELGEKINVVVLDYDEEKKRISLGMKQLSPHPWEKLSVDIKEGTEVEGKVVNIEDYGAFIEIQPGVEGLVHVSEMSWSQHLKSPEEYISLGQSVKAVVLSIDRDDRRFSLGMKQLTSDPWEKIESKFPLGSKHSSNVRSITNFGLFVELEEGVDGLVHISDLSWTKKFSHPKEFIHTGEKLDVIVLEIDAKNRRLSLGHKQLEEDPWETFESIFIPESLHEATVVKNDDKGAVVALPYGVEAFVPNKHLMKKDKSKVKVDEKLEVRILECDKESKRIIASHTDIWKGEERALKEKETGEKQVQEKKTQKDLEKVKSKVDKSTLAEETDVLKNLKDKMEHTEKEKQKDAIAKMDEKTEKKKTAKSTAKKDEVKAETPEVAEKPKKTTKKTVAKKDDAKEKKDEKAKAKKPAAKTSDKDEEKKVKATAKKKSASTKKKDEKEEDKKKKKKDEK